MNFRIIWVRGMECMCAQTGPRVILSAERVWGNGVRSHVNSKGKIPSSGSSGGSNPRCCIAQDNGPNTQPTEFILPPKFVSNMLSYHQNGGSVDKKAQFDVVGSAATSVSRVVKSPGPHRHPPSPLPRPLTLLHPLPLPPFHFLFLLQKREGVEGGKRGGMFVGARVCVRACVRACLRAWERERERERGTKRERERKRGGAGQNWPE